MSAALGRPSFRPGGGAARLVPSWFLLRAALRPCSFSAMEQTLDNSADQIKHLFEVCRASASVGFAHRRAKEEGAESVSRA